MAVFITKEKAIQVVSILNSLFTLFDDNLQANWKQNEQEGFESLWIIIIRAKKTGKFVTKISTMEEVYSHICREKSIYVNDEKTKV